MVAVIYLFVAVYYSLYDQTGSAWVLQAAQMDRRFLGIDWLPSQISSVNALLVMLYVPLFNGVSLPFPKVASWPGRLCERGGWELRRVPGIYAQLGRCGVCRCWCETGEAKSRTSWV